MGASAVTRTDNEIRADIFRQYQQKLPRIGPELDAFVANQCEYYGIDVRTCQRYIGYAKVALLAETRTGIQTATQEIAETMGITRADLLHTAREALGATKSRAVVDKSGNVLEDENGNPKVFEKPDWGARLTAVDRLAKLIGANAPVETHIEATHEHTVKYSDDELRREFAALAGGFGLRVVDAQFSVVTGGSGENASLHPGSEAESGGN